MRRVQVPGGHLPRVFPRLQVPSCPRRPAGLQVGLISRIFPLLILRVNFILLQPRLLFLGEEQSHNDDKGANDSKVPVGTLLTLSTLSIKKTLDEGHSLELNKFLANSSDTKTDLVPAKRLNSGLGFNDAQILRTCCRFYAAVLDQ